MVKPIKATLTITRAVVNPYYGNSLYSEYPPALTTNLNNKHASEKNRDRIGSLHNYINIILCMMRMALHIQYTLSLQSSKVHDKRN